MASDLAKERTTLRETVTEAEVRLASGLPLGEAIERQWDQIVRQDEMMGRLAAEKREIECLVSDDLHRRSEPRPNAYIPDDLGIPRPFGSGAFKPTPAGSSMRHIKAPKTSDIVL